MSSTDRSDYFTVSTWRDGEPIEVGALAVDASDPTYGGGGVSLGPQVYECLACGAAVLNTARHIEWHEAKP